MPGAASVITRGATFSACGEHRLLLERHWAEGPLAMFLMLNPSVADAERDDPTIRRCIGFARGWGFGGLLVANLYSRCATDPRDLARLPHAARCIEGTDAAIAEAARRTALIVEAWGAHRLCAPRAAAVRQLLPGDTPVAVLGRTRDGHPRHPLYVRAATLPVDARTGQPIARAR